jgi:hypothetical protein
MKPRIEYHNLDGEGWRKTHVYDLPPTPEIDYKGQATGRKDYWRSVTDVHCPIDSCEGLIRWAEAGYVAGYRICDRCGRHFQAEGTAEKPTLLRVGDRRGGFYFEKLKKAKKEAA